MHFQIFFWLNSPFILFLFCYYYYIKIQKKKMNKSFNSMISALYVYWPTCSLNIGISRWKTHIGWPLVLSTHPISCPVTPDRSGENPSPVKEHQAWPVQTDQSRTPCLGRGTFIPQQLGVMMWWEGGVGEIWVFPPLHAHKAPTSKWQSNRLSTYGVPPARDTSLIWKRHAYVFMWPPAPCPRANPDQWLRGCSFSFCAS